MYAIGTHIERSTAVVDQYKRVCGYDMAASQHDGQDIETVMKAAKKAVNHVRSGKGPYFIEFITYRFRGHSMSDSGAYRTKEEVEEWMKRDPIAIYSGHLKKEGVITDDEIKAMEAEIDEELENDVIKFAEQSPEPKVEDLNRFVLDDNPDPRWIGPLVSSEE
jgi:pyruvate dehydrogenase E1 component alpha subunit